MPRKKIPLSHDHAAFVERVKQCAAGRNMSLAALAKEAGIAITTLQNYTTDTEPPRSVVWALARAGRVSPGWLFAGEGAQNAELPEDAPAWARFYSNMTAVVSAIDPKLDSRVVEDYFGLTIEQLRQIAKGRQPSIRELVKIERALPFSLSELWENDVTKTVKALPLSQLLIKKLPELP